MLLPSSQKSKMRNPYPSSSSVCVYPRESRPEHAGIQRRKHSCLHSGRRWGTSGRIVLGSVAVILLSTLTRAADPIVASSSSISASTTPAPASSTSTGGTSPSGTLSSIPSSVPNGGITVLQPQQTAAQSYYKIASGSNVTFAWNFTDVLRYPSSLVVAAYCSENSNTYTLSSSLPGTATSLVWSPYDYDQSAARVGQAQLIQATYRLQITDERGLNVAASPGLFTPNSKVTFALYQPRPYVPISEGWTCASCNGGSHLRIPERRVLLMAAFVLALAMTAV